MKKTLQIIGLGLLIIIIFLMIRSGDSFRTAFTSGSLSSYWKEVGDIGPVKEIIDAKLEKNGLNQTLAEYSIAAYVEEMLYRGPVLIFMLLLGTSRKWTEALAWIPLFALSYYWATQHSYPAFYQAMILIGGLINGLCIIQMKNKALGMIAAISLHGTANIVIISSLHYSDDIMIVLGR